MSDLHSIVVSGEGAAAALSPRFRDVVHAEFTRWLATGTPPANPEPTAARPTPENDYTHPPLEHPATRLPEGWHLLSQVPCGDLGIDYHLMSRQAGGWALVVRYEDGRIGFCAAIDDLADWFNNLQRTIVRTPYAPNALPRALVKWARPILASLYDPTDPVEAAAQVLFALGGRMRTAPRAATFTQA